MRYLASSGRKLITLRARRRPGTRRSSTVLLAVVGPLAVLSPLAISATLASAPPAGAVPSLETITTVSVSPTTTTYGSSVRYSAVVSLVPPAIGFPTTGTIVFTSGSTYLCTSTFIGSGGSGSCSSNNAPVGTDTITATYVPPPDPDFAESVGNTNLTVTPIEGCCTPTMTAASVTPPTTTYGGTVTYSATVTPAAIGTVAFTYRLDPTVHRHPGEHRSVVYGHECTCGHRHDHRRL